MSCTYTCLTYGNCITYSVVLSNGIYAICRHVETDSSAIVLRYCYIYVSTTSICYHPTAETITCYFWSCQINVITYIQCR